MRKNALGLSMAFGILGCAAPQRASTPAAVGVESVKKEVSQLEEAVAGLEDHLGHLESAPAASDLDPVKLGIAQLKESLARMDDRLGHMKSAPATSELDDVKQEIAQQKESLGRLSSSVFHLESYASAASAKNELTVMTIDSVGWSSGHGFRTASGTRSTLACHVVEWRGYGKMLRFVQTSDPTFELLADGHPTVKATMETGGMTSSDGSTRFVMLDVSGTLDPNTSYHLRPRNENEQYRWSVPADLVVVASDAKR